MRDNFLFEVVKAGKIRAKPSKDASWTTHNIKPAIEQPKTKFDDLGSLEEDSYYGESDTRKRRLTPKDKKRVSVKRKWSDYYEDSISVKSDPEVSISFVPDETPKKKGQAKVKCCFLSSFLSSNLLTD